MKKADHQLVQNVLDGQMSPEEFRAFQERLRNEPELASEYVKYAHLHHALSEEFEGGFAERGPLGHLASRRLIAMPLLLAFAAMLLLGAAALWYLPWEKVAGTEEVAVLTFSVDAVWIIDGASRSIGGATGVAKGSRLSLKQGRAGISLEPSVSAVIEGPAKVEFVSGSEIQLSQGRGYFHRGGSGPALKVATPRMMVVDSGTEFGVEVMPVGADSIHVTRGSVNITAHTTGESADLKAGDAMKVGDSGKLEPFHPDERSYAKDLGRFHTVFSSPFDSKDWRVDFGNPSIAGPRIEGVNFTAYHKLPIPQPADGATVLLATIEVGKPSGGEFHTEGWAGMSFFYEGRELLFFGDSFGTRPTWSLDVKQRIPVILPENPLLGPREVTLRYDIRNGAVSLHEGSVPLKPAFCEGKLPPGLKFDEIRIGASSGAALVVESLQIRVGS